MRKIRVIAVFIALLLFIPLVNTSVFAAVDIDDQGWSAAISDKKSGWTIPEGAEQPGWTGIAKGNQASLDYVLIVKNPDKTVTLYFLASSTNKTFTGMTYGGKKCVEKWSDNTKGTKYSIWSATLPGNDYNRKSLSISLGAGDEIQGTLIINEETTDVNPYKIYVDFTSSAGPEEGYSKVYGDDDPVTPEILQERIQDSVNEQLVDLGLEENDIIVTVGPRERGECVPWSPYAFDITWKNNEDGSGIYIFNDDPDKGDIEVYLAADLTINKARLVIKSESASKTYDGYALKRPKVTVAGLKFDDVYSDAVAIGEIVYPGSTPNLISEEVAVFTTMSGGNSISDNYEIIRQIGVLTILAPVTAPPPAASLPTASPPATAPSAPHVSSHVESFIQAEPPDVSSVITPIEIPLASSVDTMIRNDSMPSLSIKAWALTNLVLTVMTCFIMAMLLVTYFFRKPDMNEAESGEEPDNEKNTFWHFVLRMLAVSTAAVSIITFTLTQNMSLPMTLVDGFTVWHLFIALITLGIAFLSKKTFVEQEEPGENQAG